MGQLERRRLGRTEMWPRALALGGGYLGRAGLDESDAIAAVRRAIELGVDYVDTSAGYGDSERRVGLALQNGWREKVFLQTKTGSHRDRRGDFSAEGTRWSVENSLRLLHTDYLDAVLIHDPRDIEVPLAPGACLDELLKMKARGIVRHIGIGCRPHDFHRRAIETGEMEIVLTFHDYTLVGQSVAETTLPLAARHDVGVQLGTILASGRLSGKEPKDEPAHAMWEWCEARGVSLRHLAVQFAMNAPGKPVVVVGASRIQHVEEIHHDATTEVPAEVWQAFRERFGVGVIADLV